MHFMTEVSHLQEIYGFTRKVAVLIVRIQRGLDSLDWLCQQGVVHLSESYRISQYLG